MSLIIVESPTKARTFNRYLKGKNYFVFATIGHIRDLPENELAIDYSKNFLPKYQIIKNKEKIVKALKKLAEKNDQIILATDLDREGESIAYHIAYILGFIEEEWPNFKIKFNSKKLLRIIFHEITPSALKEALEKPIGLRENLIKAQQGRRILDRIVGYELSPLLWKKIGKNWLSAGRVQTVALRLIVEREKEIENFPEKSFYEIFGTFIYEQNKKNFFLKAKLIKGDNEEYYQKKTIFLFTGNYTYSFTTIDKKKLDEIKKDLINDEFFIKDINEKIEKKQPPPPFTTSLLQQEAFNHFGFSSKLTMRLAQDLYESGLITYHRTDSFDLNYFFVLKLRDYIEKNYGRNYLSEKPRLYKTKSKLAQEAHEAIRPTQLKENYNFKSINHKKLYSLIFKRTLAVQMKESEYKVYQLVINSKKGYFFQCELKNLIFDGFFKILKPKLEENIIDISLKKGNKIVLKEVNEKLSKTSPPPRYSEATLIKTLEEKGIGRPSTYAGILSLIQDKHYVEKINRYFIPTKLGRSISDYLSSSFTNIFDLNFTANMEDDLDKIANGEKDLIKTLSDFYDSFKKNLDLELKNQQVINVEEKIDEKCPRCGNELVVRYSKYGKFIACKKYPSCEFTKSFLNFVENKKCPQCGGRIVIKFTKNKKKFFGCENYPKCNYASWKLKKII